MGARKVVHTPRQWVCFLPVALCVAIAGLPVFAEDLFQLINAGDAAMSRSQFSAAVEAYSKAIAVDPKQFLAYTKRAAAYVSSNKHSLAIRDFAAALELEPSSVTVLLKKAQLELQLCNFEGAVRDFEQVLKLKPEHKVASSGITAADSAKTSLAKAQAHLDAMEVKEADDAIAEVFRTSSDCLQGRYMTAELFRIEERYEEVVAETGRILKMDPHNVKALLLRAEGYYYLQDFDMAKRHYGEVLTKYDPDNKAAKDSFKELKALQRKVAKTRKAISSRTWKEVDNLAGEVLHELPTQLTKIASEMWLGLALSRFHQKKPDDQILEAVDAVLYYGPDGAAAEIKVKTFIRAERWEAAIQAAEKYLEENERTQTLITLLQEAQTGLKISKQKDYYKVLGVPRDVDERTLKKAYRTMALKYHPDKVDSSVNKEDAEKKFAEINEAYEILSDEEKRQLHDMGEDPNSPNAGHGFGGGFPGGGFHGFQQGGQRFNFRFN